MLQVAGCMVRRGGIRRHCRTKSNCTGGWRLPSLHKNMLRFSSNMRRITGRTVEAIRLGQSVGDEELERSRAHCLELREKLTAKMDRLGIDLWVCPVATGPLRLGWTQQATRT